MMSFDDYVNHIIEKCRLAQAIVIIQSKPDSLTIEEYITNLQNNINPDPMDSDLDISVPSEDFEYDSVNHTASQFVTDNVASDVINHFSEETAMATNEANRDCSLKNNNTQRTSDSFVYDNVNNANQLDTENLATDLVKNTNVKTRMINYEVDPMNDVEICNTQDSIVSLSVLNGFDSNMLSIQPNQTQSNATEYFDILEELKEVERDGKTNNIDIYQNLSQITYYEGSQNVVNPNSETNEMTKIKDILEARINDPNTTMSEENSRSIRIAKNKHVILDNTYHINTNELEETQLYTVPVFTQECTHYSQSQFDNITMDSKYITNKDKSINKKLNDENVFIEFSQNAQNLDLYLNEIYNVNNTNYDSQENSNNRLQNDVLTDRIDEVNHKINSNVENDQCELNTMTSDVEKQIIVSNINECDKNDSNEVIEMTEEIVPFKVVEELNKVKIFLKRRGNKRLDGNSLDSGYRSGSQGKKFHLAASQAAVSWLNQSAHFLCNFIKTCPLVSATKGVVKEISQVLGTLVDKLHEDETYPSFLEEILEIVDTTLSQICEGDSSCDNALLIKDDQMQRILLINKSKHIQKYTINNITKYIENIFREMQNEEAYEIKNINELENLCYILYILELILVKYTKEVAQPTPQTSQDDDKLKKSSLSDIWRRKWNPSCDDEKPKKIEEKCSLQKCSEVLNKLVVGGMESYSLISYAALKCFNLLQSL